MCNLLWKEWKEISTKKFLLCLSLVSIILIIGTSYIVFEKKQDVVNPYVTIGVTDYDDSVYSNMLVDYFKRDDNFSKYAQIVEGEEKRLQERMQLGEIDAYLVLPKDFAKNLIRIEQVPVDVKISTEDSTTAIVLSNVLKSYEQYISAVEVNAVALYEIMKKDGMDMELIDRKNKEISIDLIMTALGRDSIFDYKVDNRVSYDTLPEYYVTAIIAVVLLYLGMIPGIRLLMEREEHITDRIRISRISVFSYYSSKWIIYTVLFSFMINVCYLILCITGGMSLEPQKIVLLDGFIAVSILLTIFIAGICKKQRLFLLVGNVFYLLCAVLGGAVIPVMYLPDNFYRLAQFTPNFWFMKYMLSI